MKRRLKREERKKGRGKKGGEKKKEEKKKGGEKKKEEKKMHHRGSNPGPFAWKVRTLTVDRPRQFDCMHVHISGISIDMN